MLRHFILVCLNLILLTQSSFAQETHIYMDENASFKQAVALFDNEQYALAYPIFKSLNPQPVSVGQNADIYLKDEILCKLIVCQLRLIQPVAEREALDLLPTLKNNQLKELLSFHLALVLYQQLVHFQFLVESFR